MLPPHIPAKKKLKVVGKKKRLFLHSREQQAGTEDDQQHQKPSRVGANLHIILESGRKLFEHIPERAMGSLDIEETVAIAIVLNGQRGLHFKSVLCFNQTGYDA